MEDTTRIRRAMGVAVCVAIMVVALIPRMASAQAPAPKAVYTLKDLIQRALATSPEIRQFQRGSEVAMAKKDQADAAR